MCAPHTALDHCGTALRTGDPLGLRIAIYTPGAATCDTLTCIACSIGIRLLHALPTVIAMTVTAIPESLTGATKQDICKADVERFLFGKHITACPACGRFRSKCDLDVHTITCQKSPSCGGETTSVDVLMLVCQNCGAIQFHDRSVVAKWLDCHEHGARSR